MPLIDPALPPLPPPFPLLLPDPTVIIGDPPDEKNGKYKVYPVALFGERTETANKTIAFLHQSDEWCQVRDVAEGIGMTFVGRKRVDYLRIVNALIDLNLIERHSKGIRLIRPATVQEGGAS
jgi:hypothetical protein